MRREALIVVACACGGELVVDAPDATVDAQEAPDAAEPPFLEGGPPPAFDAAPPQDAGCMPYVSKSCDGGCADGSVCVMNTNQGPVPVPNPPPPSDKGCVPVPKQCASTPDCTCMGECACPNGLCGDDNQYGMICGSNTVSRREFKKDIEYVDDDERQELARRTLATDQSHADQYGVSSMLLATIQQQQR